MKAPLTNMELVDDGNSLLVVAKSTLFKVEMNACSSFKTCNECVHKSPHCGWCAGECTTASQCASPATWLTLTKTPTTDVDVQAMCMEIASVQPARKFKYDNEWIEVDFKRELTTVAPVNSTFECVFRNEITKSTTETSENNEKEEEEELMKTDAVVMSPTKLKCALPHLSKIKFR